MYHNLQSRLTKTLLHAFLDPSKAMTQHYGAIQGLSALGPSVVIHLTRFYGHPVLNVSLTYMF